MKTIFFFIFNSLCFYSAYAQNTDKQKRYIKTPTGYLMVLRQGDSILTNIQQLALAENIPSAGFTGIGFAGYAKFGYFNAQTKEYEPKEFFDVEIASFSGSIAWENGKPSLHVHAVVTGKDFNAVGGHLLTAAVGTGSMEIMITVYDRKLERKKDPAIGANVLQLE